MRTLTVVAAALVLSGCGVDGPPVAPMAQAQPGVTVTGVTVSGRAAGGGR